MNSQDEVAKELRAKKRLFWASIVFCGILGLVGIIIKNLMATVVGFGLVVVVIIVLRKLKKVDQNMIEYHPGQGFRFFRVTRERRLRQYTILQFVVALMVVLYFLYKPTLNRQFFFGVGAILYIQYYFKKRIKLHNQMDSASLFELEEMGIITSQHFVESIYKDFKSWENLEKGNKILIVTQDSLIYIMMEDQVNASRMECKLSNINKLAIVGSGRNGKGYIVSAGTSDNRNIRFKLEGDSSHDSPEEFISYFLKALDEALMSPTPAPINQPIYRNGVQGEVKGNNDNNDDHSNQVRLPKLNIRQLDLLDHEPTSDNNTNQAPSNERYLDL